MAYLGLLHGLSQGMTRQALADAESFCTAAVRARLTAEAANREVDVP